MLLMLVLNPSANHDVEAEQQCGHCPVSDRSRKGT
jgi:hypothetical protein